MNLQKRTEHVEQCHLFRWAELESIRLPELKTMFAIPNGGKRNKITAWKMKLEGVRAGIPDAMLPIPRGEHHGLFIEMKREKGGTTPEIQKQWHKALREHGYRVEVCKGFESAKNVILDYLTKN